MSEFSRTLYSVILLFMELSGFKGSQKLKESDEMILEKMFYTFIQQMGILSGFRKSK